MELQTLNKLKKTVQRLKLHPLTKVLIFFFFFITVILLGNYIKTSEELKLKDSVKTKAVITKTGASGGRKIHTGYLKFKVKNQLIEASVHADWTILNVGDTVEITYSKLDPTIFRITDFYYEKKKEIIKNLN